MKKLISRNPILRFKLGRKLIKAQKGWNGTFHGITPGGKVLLNDAKPNAEKYFTQWDKVMTPEQMQLLVDTGWFNKDLSFASVTNFQNALKNFLAKDGFEKGQGLKIDGMWGNQTLKALEMALMKAKSPVYTVDGELYTKGSNWPITQMNSEESKNVIRNNLIKPIINADLNLNIKSATEITPNIPKLNNPPSGPANYRIKADRSITRDIINELGGNAYDYTGYLRKALRHYLNGEQLDDKMKGALSAFGDLSRFDRYRNTLNTINKPFMKLGGVLPSRNPIIRFKNRKFN